MIDFTTIPESPLPHFKDGKETFFARFAGDTNCKILYGRLPAGATIGLHTHEDTAEIIFFLSGTGKMLLDGEEETIAAGLCHYCPKGSTHSMINEGDGDITFYAVVPKQ
jgi:mannose-6-phosphate isomerase-like protein (cupin superfamily)